MLHRTGSARIKFRWFAERTERSCCELLQERMALAGLLESEVRSGTQGRRKVQPELSPCISIEDNKGQSHQCQAITNVPSTRDLLTCSIDWRWTYPSMVPLYRKLARKPPVYAPETSAATSKAILSLELIPGFIQSAEDSSTDHTLFCRGILGYLSSFCQSRSRSQNHKFQDIPCQDAPSQWPSYTQS